MNIENLIKHYKCVRVGGKIRLIETNINTKTCLCFDQQVFSCEIN